ncbi:MAG TPA: CDP-alcohol phosphatidyltransferase family protein [Anaerolineales bacterium]|nr:CDP-alcohol phosphatidyltransferase family protein [Anaerolineales bacterium]
MSDITQHRRVNDILLGPLERPTLRWLAAHMPAWVTPDICTLIGVLGALGVALSYVLSMSDSIFLWFASLGFIINWFGDSLDGTLARHRRIERPRFGFFVDHTTDAFSATVIFLGLGVTPYVSFNVACLALIAYLLLCVLVFVRTSVVGEFKISYSMLGPTEIRAVAILLNIAMYFGGIQTLSFTFAGMGQITFSSYDVTLGLVALLLFFFFIVNTLQETIRLAKENK